MLPEVERQVKNGKQVAFRADAASGEPEIYAALEERGLKYAIRIPADENLGRDIAELPSRPVGRASVKPLEGYRTSLSGWPLRN